MFENLCRLCLSETDLLWIFDERMTDNMPDIIKVTSGVEIKKEDTVTQMVCNTCCQITIKMYKFRTTSIKNDKDLKAKCAGYNISQLTNGVTDATNKEPLNKGNHSIPKEATITPSSTVTSKSTIPKSTIQQKYKLAHPSIKKILNEFPNIKIPKTALYSHVGAYITLMTDEVDDWFKERRYTDSDILKIKRGASEYAKTLENLPVPHKKRRRKSSVEKSSSVNTKPSLTPEESLSNIPSKNKKIKLQGGVTVNPLKSNDNIANKPNSDSVSSVSDTVKSSSDINSKSATKQNESSISDKKVNKVSTPVEHSAKLADISNIKLDTSSAVPPRPKSRMGRSKSKIQSTSEVKTKSSAEMTTAPEISTTSVETNVQPEAQVTPLVNDKTDNTENSLPKTSRLRKKKSPNKDANVESDTDDPGNDPSYDPGNDVDYELSEPEVIEVDEACNSDKQPERPVRQVAAPVTYNDDYTMFTTRPFVKNAMINNLCPKQTNDQGPGELFVLSDSDEDCESVSVTTDGENSSQATGKQNKSDNVDELSNKTEFAKSLDLAPKDTNNMPDLSLISVTNKTSTLYICEICDSHENSLKELKIHKRRTHMKCRFCSKRFRSFAKRDLHMYTCAANDTPTRLKKAKLQLIRVDEIAEIRRQFPSAFELFDNEKNMTDNSESNINDAQLNVHQTTDHHQAESILRQNLTSVTHSAESSTSGISQPLLSTLLTSTTEKVMENVDARKNYDAETEHAVRELERFLQTIPVLPPAENSPDDTGNKTSAESEVEFIPNNVDIICISDDETETTNNISTSSQERSKPKIHIVDNDILRNINRQSSDTGIIKNIIMYAKSKKVLDKISSVDELREHAILDGNTARVKIFKNLRKQLHHYKIPVEIMHNPTLVVEYKNSKNPAPKKKSDLWFGLIPQDLNSPQAGRTILPKSSTGVPSTNLSYSVMPQVNIPNSGNHTVILQAPSTNNLPHTMVTPNGLYAPRHVNVAQLNQNKRVENFAYNSQAPQPQQHSTNTTGGQNLRKTVLTSVNQQNYSNPPIILNGTRNLFTSPTNRNQMTSTIATQKNVTYTSQNSGSQQTSTSTSTVLNCQSATASASNNCQVSSTISTSNTLIFNPQTNENTYTNAPVILSGTQNINTSTIPNGFTNLILMSTPLVQSSEQATSSSLHIPGPLPVIQSVTTASELGDAASPSSNNPKSVIPSIRVKNLSELS